MIKKILVLHNPIDENSTEDEKDVYVQATDVSDALRECGFEPVIRGFDFNMDFEEDVFCIFNLVEAVNGKSRFAYLAPALFELKGIPYTGCGPEAMAITTDKYASKRILLGSLLPAPGNFGEIPDRRGRRYILKPKYEDGSLYIDSDSITTEESTDDRLKRAGKDFFAEEYIEGREFSVSLVWDEKDVSALPPCEIKFTKGSGVKIVDYRSKWEPDSIEYISTIPVFPDDEEDRELLGELKELAIKCAHLFSLKGYARIDFRVDERTGPYIIDINANPCIAKDAGFARSCLNAGIEYKEAVYKILREALK